MIVQQAGIKLTSIMRLHKFFLIALIVCALLAPGVASAQSSSVWKYVSSLLQPVVSTWNVYSPADFRFDGDLLPDGSDCAAGEILKKVGANDWDCAQDDSASDPFTHPTAGVSATTSEMRSPTASTSALRVSASSTFEYLTTGLAKITNGVLGLAGADVDYQVPLTFGDGLTRTVDDVDCDTASASVFGCLTSAFFTEFNNKVGSSSLPYIYSLSGLGSIGSSTATTTFPGNVRIEGALQVIDRIITTTLYVVTEVFYAGITGPNFTATSTSVASIFPLASTTAISINPGTGQTGLKMTAANGSCAALVDIENQFTTDVFNITCAGVTSFDTLQVFNAASTQNQLGGYLLDTTSVTTLQSALTTRSAASFGTPHNSASPMVTFVKTASDDTGNFYRAGGLYVDWVSAVAASRTGKLRLTLNDFNGERDVLTATSTGSASTLSVGLAINGGVVGVGTSSPQAKFAVGAGNILLDNNQYLQAYRNGGTAVSILGINGSSQTQLTAGGGNALILQSGGATAMTLSSTQLVGIGTTTPDYLLTLGNAAGLANNKIAIDAAAARQSSIAFRSAGVNKWHIGRGDSDVLSDSTFFIGSDSGNANDPGGNAARFVIDSTGKVGIGTTTPGAQLSASSSGAVVAGLFDSRDTGDIARFTAAGVAKLTVGIATSTFAHAISLVNGNNATGIPFRYCEAVVYNGSSPQLIYSARDGTVIQDVYWESTTGWAGALGANLKLGDAGDNEGLMNIPFAALSDTTNWYGQDPSVRGNYMWDSTDSFGKQKVYTTATAINIYHNPGASTQGAGQVCMTIMELK